MVSGRPADPVWMHIAPGAFARPFIRGDLGTLAPASFQSSPRMNGPLNAPRQTTT
jgi:hypothetical protein